MKVLTVWQPWATLIAIGAKPYEFRSHDYRRRNAKVEGQRIAIHAGTRRVKPDEVRGLIRHLDAHGSAGTALVVEVARPYLVHVLNHPEAVAYSAIVATATLGSPTMAYLLNRPTDSDRFEHSLFGWPMMEIAPVMPPVPVRGFQGFWNYEGSL